MFSPFFWHCDGRVFILRPPWSGFSEEESQYATQPAGAVEMLTQKHYHLVKIFDDRHSAANYFQQENAYPKRSHIIYNEATQMLQEVPFVKAYGQGKTFCWHFNDGRLLTPQVGTFTVTRYHLILKQWFTRR
jgi:hypothetical protein